MLSYRQQGLEVDSCPECFGIWFDREELKEFLKHPDWVQRLASSDKGGGVAVPPVPKSRKCPQCQCALMESSLGEVLVDVCTRCRGIWLDQGELEGAVEQYRQGKRGNLVVLNQIAEGLRAIKDAS